VLSDSVPTARPHSTADPDPTRTDPTALAATYLVRVRRGHSTARVAAAIRDLDPAALADRLADDAHRLAFWLNVYNAATQDLLAAAPEQYEARNRFFAAPIVAVAGHDLSLNDVEHGILRRSRLAWGFGYLPDPVPDAFERAHRVDAPDPRVHFALNCGAESCPAILAYDPADVDDQLDRAARGYLESTVDYDAVADVVRVPRVMGWYRGDFGGRDGILATLRSYDLLPADAAPGIRYRSWDWTLSRGDFGGSDGLDGERAPGE
jgi:hypothetical protein